MSQVEPKGKTKASVLEKAKSGECLIDRCDGKAKRRGLCDSCYMKYRRALMDKPVEERIAFEAETIRNGLILAQGQIAKIRRPNPFLTSEA